MKTIKLLLLATGLFVLTLPGKAQLFPNTYMNIDWQSNFPVGSGLFADKASGWGMNFEGGYYFCPRMAVGLFINYQTNLGNSALTAAQKHALFQLPFGVASRYVFLPESVLQPYVGTKIGACYAEMSSYYYTVKQYSDSWGFYFSPEVGVSIFPRPDYRLGFHVAAFYSIATNSSEVLGYTLDNIGGFGLRVGVSF